MKNHPSEIPTSDAQLPAEVDTETLEIFVESATDCHPKDHDIEELPAVVAIIESIIDQMSNTDLEYSTEPSEAKWAAAAGNKEAVANTDS